MNRLYQTRRRSKPDASRVNWRKTRVSLTSCLDDSESGTSTPSTSSESEFEDDQSEEESPPEVAVDHKPNREGSDAEEVCAVPQSRRKRFSTTILTESSSDSDSDVGGRPVRKLLPKKRQNVQLSDSEAEAAAKQDAEKKAAEVKETAAKRRDRRNKLLELSKKRRSRTSRSRRRKLEGSSEAECHSNDGNDDEKEECTSYQEVHSSEEEEGDKDSLKDFIVESDDQKGGEGSSVQGAEGSLLSHHLPQFVPGSMLTHFQVVVKAFLINALDESFLKSLYDGERTKKYALEMKNSLYHLEQRCILPRLENLKQRSRWSDRYKMTSQLLISHCPTTCSLDPIPTPLLQSVSPHNLSYIFSSELLVHWIFHWYLQTGSYLPPCSRNPPFTPVIQNYHCASLLYFLSKMFEHTVFKNSLLFYHRTSLASDLTI
ncbi:coiled-coil domain-containing protein 82 isoform X2 [Anguilla rostrata]|uniref:coiled-coil domain-containing protein 82 isoform X2 n=1 Tax=Anguilla rostrata TaxID=7938 RepID=UPI0030CE5A88